MRLMHRFLTSTVSLAGLVVGAPVLAAEADNAGQLQEIVVTAQKRSESVREVPATINVVGGEALAKAGVANLQDVAAMVPGLEIGSASGTQTGFVTIRGMPPQIFGDPTAVVFLDGFTTNSRRAVMTSVLDLERVEVLKGPQGTVYGANVLGGAINMVTRKPSETFGGFLRGSYGEYNSVVAQGSVTGALVPGLLSVRVAGGINNHDGYWRNRAQAGARPDSLKTAAAQVALRFTPSESFTTDVVYIYDRTRQGCGDCPNPLAGYVGPIVSDLSKLDFNNLEPFIDQNRIGFYNRDIHTGLLTNTLTTDAVTLTSVTGYSDLDSLDQNDLDRGPVDLAPTLPMVDVPARERVFSQELRVASNSSGPLKWLLGAFYYHSRTDTATNFLVPPTTLIPFNATLEHTRNYAFFVNADYALTSRLKVGVGLRYDANKRDQTNLFTKVYSSTDSKELLPKASLTYAIDDRTNLYATVSRGYKTGGLNVNGPATFDPEYVMNYEIGVKGMTADRRLSYEFSTYYMDWTKQQVQLIIGLFPYIGNAGLTQIYGAEAVVHYKPASALTVDVAVNYNHSRYKRFVDTTAVPTFFGFSPDRAGATPAMAPDWSGSIAIQHVAPIGGGLDISTRVDARYTGDRSTDADGIARASAFVLANANIGIGNEKTRLSVFARNIFNKRYNNFTQLFGTPLIPPNAHLGAPRVAGIQFEQRF